MLCTICVCCPQVDALSQQRSVLALGAAERDRELERLALSECDAVSELAHLQVRDSPNAVSYVIFFSSWLIPAPLPLLHLASVAHISMLNYSLRPTTYCFVNLGASGCVVLRRNGLPLACRHV